jgi:signal transduction histidine kinase
VTTEHPSGRVLGAGAVSLIGSLAASAHLFHLLTEREIRARLLGVFVPLTAAFVLVLAGLWLYRSTLDDASTPRVAAWTGLGLGGGVTFGYPVVPYQAAHGVALVDVPFLLANWSTAGALVGFLVGLYDARQRQSRSALEDERAELADRELELQRQNERLDQFASVISHDLRNPLNVATGRLDLAQQETDSEHLEAARTALERMEGLIEGLLALARQGQPLDDTEPVTLSTVVERCWAVVDTGEATLTVDPDGTFVADFGRLQQLLENLFRNSVEHGGTDVAVHMGVLSDGSGFYVADDGLGIPEAKRDEVFASGYSTSEDGTGFGLAIVTEIVDAHGWEIRVTESTDGGARFEIRGVELLDRH